MNLHDNLHNSPCLDCQNCDFSIIENFVHMWTMLTNKAKLAWRNDWILSKLYRVVLYINISEVFSVGLCGLST